MSSKEFTIIAKPHPFKTNRVLHHAPVGSSLLKVLGPDVDDNVSVSIEGEYIPREMWDKIKPKTGTQIHVTRYPRGRTVRKVVTVVLLVLIYIYAPMLAPYLQTLGMGATAASAVAFGVTMLAVAAVTALMPPPEMPKMSTSDAAEFNRLNSITGTSNANVPYGTIPMVIGECRFYPPFAAMPYTEILGDQQYLRMLLDLGYGDDLVISDIRIGETPLEDFADVEYEISRTPDLFSSDIFELGLVDNFSEPGTVVTKTSQTNSDELSTDIIFPSGLFGGDDKGNTTSGTTSFTLEYQPISGGAWVNVATMQGVTLSTPAVTVSGSNFQIYSKERKTLRVGIRWPVAKGQYNVRWTRNATTFAAGTNDSVKSYTAQLGVLRSIRHTLPSDTGTLKLALKIKATDQLNGVVNQLSVLAQQKIRIYDSVNDVWTSPQVTFNPAWIYHWLLTSCPGVAQLVDNSRVDLDRIIEFADQCEIRNFTCKGMIDKAVSSGDLYKLILSAGRGAFAMRDGMYSVLIDDDNQVPVQHFSPANTSNFAGNRVFVEVPHALRVQFQNPELNWQQDEIIVLRDGYSYDGKGPRGEVSANPPATKFETLTVPYVTNPIQAWQLARYHFAQALFRPNVYSFKAGLENLVCTRGDLVYMTHDVTEWGSGFGLISDVVRSGGAGSTVTKIISAEPLHVEAGITYSIRVRSKTGISSVSNIAAMSPGEHTEFTLLSPMPGSVDTGDLYLIGSTESAIRKLIITRLSPGTDLEANLQAVEYDSRVESYDDNPPTQFISAISGSLILEPPPPPNVYAVFSSFAGETDSGGDTTGVINIGLDPGNSGHSNNGPPWRLGFLREQ